MPRTDFCCPSLSRSVCKGRVRWSGPAAVITAAGPDQRTLPLQTLLDSDGQQKSVLGILIEQALAAKVEEICVVVWPGDESRYVQAAGSHAGMVRFIAQPQPLGYGHAIYCA